MELGTRAAASDHKLAGDLSRNISSQRVGFVQRRFAGVRILSFQQHAECAFFSSALEFTWFTDGVVLIPTLEMSTVSLTEQHHC